MPGYLSFPALSETHVAFVAEDSLWVARRDDGPARRITTDIGEVQFPRFSPDGRHIAFTADSEGTHEVYVVEVDGGVPRRLTYRGGECRVVGFRRGGSVLYVSNVEGAVGSDFAIYEMRLDGTHHHRLPLGRVMTAHFDADDDSVVLGLNTMVNANWKRYRGGTAGDLWIGSMSKQSFRSLVRTGGNPITPVFAHGRVFFVDDVDGYGNLWSCSTDGDDVQQHTHHRDYYVRHLSSHESTLIYMKAAALYVYDARTNTESRLDIDMRPSGVELQRKFVDAEDHLHTLDLSSDGKSILANVRGKVLRFGPWSGPVRAVGERDGVRYRLAQWMAGGEHVVMVSDEGGEEAVEVHPTVSGARRRIEIEGARRTKSLFPNPHHPSIAVCDVAGGVWLVEFPKRSGDDDTEPTADLHGSLTIREIARSDNGAVVEAAWSPDGRWFAYVVPVGWPHRGGSLVLFDTVEGTRTTLATDDLPISHPVFDPNGRFLYVLAARTFNPVFSAVDFGASIPYATKLYAYVLAADQVSPFDDRYLDILEAEEDEDDDDASSEEEASSGEEASSAGEGKEHTKKDDDDSEPEEVHVDLEGLPLRMVECPDVPVGIYTHLQIAENKILYLSHPTLGLLDERWPDDPGDEEVLPHLISYDLKTQKLTTAMTGVEKVSVRGDKSLMYTTKGLFLLATGEEAPKEPTKPGFNRHTGHVDLDRLRVAVLPAVEWKQMFREAWRLQRDHFWTENMADIDWPAVRERYRPLLDHVATRVELSDLIWEMQGELGTSHAYEFGGDYPARNDYAVGSLGADLSWDGAAWRIDRILTGDPWAPHAGSPLVAPAAGARVGDRITRINGAPLSEVDSPGKLLVNQADVDVELTLLGSDGEERTVTVHTRGGDRGLRYREWVNDTRALVLEKSRGQLGYVHIPNMAGEGLSEFLRSFAAQSKRPGLIVDIRNNGGGFVSQIIIEHLRRRVIGFDRPRYGRVSTYPTGAVRGPIVALCDQFAGSDGDVFAHAFKRYEIGTLVGTRTWGGVIGIDVNELLADGTIVTQPEYSSYYDDVGWGVENYGVDPHVVVEPTPADIAAGRDVQLEKAIEIALSGLRANPVSDPIWPAVPTRRAP